MKMFLALILLVGGVGMSSSAACSNIVGFDGKDIYFLNESGDVENAISVSDKRKRAYGISPAKDGLFYSVETPEHWGGEIYFLSTTTQKITHFGEGSFPFFDERDSTLYFYSDAESGDGFWLYSVKIEGFRSSYERNVVSRYPFIEPRPLMSGSTVDGSGIVVLRNDNKPGLIFKDGVKEIPIPNGCVVDWVGENFLICHNKSDFKFYNLDSNQYNLIGSVEVKGSLLSASRDGSRISFLCGDYGKYSVQEFRLEDSSNRRLFNGKAFHQGGLVYLD